MTGKLNSHKEGRKSHGKGKEHRNAQHKLSAAESGKRNPTPQKEKGNGGRSTIPNPTAGPERGEPTDPFDQRCREASRVTCPTPGTKLTELSKVQPRRGASGKIRLRGPAKATSRVRSQLSRVIRRWNPDDLWSLGERKKGNVAWNADGVSQMHTNSSWSV